MLKEILFGCERYKNQTINCLGDSITSDYSDDNSSWVEMLHRALPVKKINNYGIAGTTVADDGIRNDCFAKRFLDMDKTADVIIVFGGINDFNRSILLGDISSSRITEFYGALKVVCRGLIEMYPEADIFFITPIIGTIKILYKNFGGVKSILKINLANFKIFSNINKKSFKIHLLNSKK